MNYSFIKINFFVFFLIILINLGFCFFKENNFLFKSLVFLNTFLVLFLFLINFIFYKKLRNFILKSNFTNLNNNGFIQIDKKNNTLINFKENNDLEKLIKRYILKSNIEKKNLDEIKTTFMKFLPKQIYDEIGEKGYERIALGNFKIKNICVMFIDIVGFTSISEKINHERALFLLNIYFDGIGEIILKNKGYIDKYLGDGIMVIFDEGNEENAIIAAIEIQEFIKKFKVGDLGKKINIGIGINFGEVVVGVIGTKKRMEVTVIGDTVNTASRLEDLTRKYDKNIIISESVFAKLENKSKFSIIYLGKETLRGKEKEVSFFGVDPYFVI